MANLVVGDLTPRNQYTATSGQTDFTYSFPIFTDGDLKVYIGSTLKTLTTDYTVSGAGTDNGGTVTLTSGATAGDIVTIYRDMPVQRTSDYQTNGDLLAETLNDDLDKLAMMIQQVEYDLNNRCLRFGQFTTGIPLSEFTESDTDRAGKVLGFAADGSPNITQELGTWQGDWTTKAYVLRDLVKDASNDNVYICTTAHTATGTTPIKTNAGVGNWALLIDAEAAASSASSAASSATAAATSETNAAASASAASTSETNAASSATTAGTHATNASTSETNAATSATNAATSETNAATSETNAASSATNAASSATTATTQASNASTSATNAATSETNAASSATSASGSATTATTQASNAASSATAASTSETNAASSATAAQTAQAAAEAAADNFDDTYLGAKASDPTLDNDGDALTAGDLYFNTTSNEMKYYNGSAWTAIVTYTHPTGAGNEHLPSTVSQTEAGYLDGVTSAIQTQIDGKEPADATILKDADIGVNVQAYDADTAKTDVTQNFTKPQRSADTVDNDGSFDLNAAQNFTCTPTGNITLTFTNIPDGQSGTILLDNSGGHTISAHANTKVMGADFLTTVSTAGIYIVGYMSDGTNVRVYNSGVQQ